MGLFNPRPRNKTITIDLPEDTTIEEADIIAKTLLKSLPIGTTVASEFNENQKRLAE